MEWPDSYQSQPRYILPGSAKEILKIPQNIPIDILSVRYRAFLADQFETVLHRHRAALADADAAGHPVLEGDLVRQSMLLANPRYLLHHGDGAARINMGMRMFIRLEPLLKDDGNESRCSETTIVGGSVNRTLSHQIIRQRKFKVRSGAQKKVRFHFAALEFILQKKQRRSADAAADQERMLHGIYVKSPAQRANNVAGKAYREFRYRLCTRADDANEQFHLRAINSGDTERSAQENARCSGNQEMQELAGLSQLRDGGQFQGEAKDGASDLVNLANDAGFLDHLRG